MKDACPEHVITSPTSPTESITRSMLICHTAYSGMVRLSQFPAEALHRDRVVLEPDPQLFSTHPICLRHASTFFAPLSSLLCRQLFHVFILTRPFQLARISCGFPSRTPSQSCGSAVWRSSQDAVMRDVHEHTTASL